MDEFEPYKYCHRMYDDDDFEDDDLAEDDIKALKWGLGTDDAGAAERPWAMVTGIDDDEEVEEEDTDFF